MSDICVVCSDPVRPRQQGFLCDDCEEWTHRKCGTDSTLTSKRGLQGQCQRDTPPAVLTHRTTGWVDDCDLICEECMERELSKDPKLKGVYISKFTLKDKDESLQETKPCHKESLASLHCVTWREKAECDEVVENYKRCQKFWNRVIEDRVEKGIYPGLPPVKDRQKIIDEYNFLIQDKKPFFNRPV